MATPYGIPPYHDKIKFKAILMTVERAQQLLDNNHPKNLTMKPAKIKQMTNDILNGDWRLTPEPIIVSSEGVLLDGQNRCMACLNADIAIPVFLCTGAPEDVMLAVNVGASRNVADVARIMGKDIKNVSGVVSIAKRMACSLQRHVPMSIQETLDWIESYKDAIAFAYECLPVNKVGLTQAPVRAVIARAYYHRPVNETRARCKQFGEVLLSGLMSNTKKDQAAIRLRNYLQDSFSRGKKVRNTNIKIAAEVVQAKTEVALMHFLNENPIESLRETSTELFFLPGETKETTDTTELEIA
jgi:hypothetical protein